MGQDWFLAMSLWVANMIIPAWDSGLLLDANDASEKAMNRRSSVLIGCILMWTSLCFLALWRTLLAVKSVDTVAEFICDWRWLRALAMSGRVCTAAYCSEPTRPRRLCLSFSVTFSFSWSFLSCDIWIAGMWFTYFVCESSILLSGCWNSSIPVNVNAFDFLEPKGYFASSLEICEWKYASPP